MDASIAQAAREGFQAVFSWPNILYPTAATLVAMLVAFVPGLGGTTLMALAIALTFAWDPLHILLTFGALTGGATFAGSITGILFNVPGGAPNAATLLDGYPMAQQGRARTAIGCAAAASALGSTIGIGILIALLPLLRGFILAFGPPEFLMLAIWGLATIGLLTGRSVTKGLAAAGLGLLLATIGLDPQGAEVRFTAGIPELQDGLGIVPVLLGIFGIAEMLSLSAASRQRIAGSERLSGSVREGIMAVFRHRGLLLRSALTGTVVGMIPAVGGTVAGFLAYGQAVQGARDRSAFGHGDIRGVIAPEAAHDAKDGGSLAPTLAFGIPGSEGTAVLLAALAVHGFVPGRELLGSQLSSVFVLIWSLFYSNWLTSILGVALTGALARTSLLPVARLAPVIVIVAAMGAFAYRGRFSDVVIALACGVVGFYLKRHSWPRVPLVTALVLGPLFERNLLLTLNLQAAGRLDFFARPIVWAIVALAVATFASSGWRKALQPRRP